VRSESEVSVSAQNKLKQQVIAVNVLFLSIKNSENPPLAGGDS